MSTKEAEDILTAIEDLEKEISVLTERKDKLKQKYCYTKHDNGLRYDTYKTIQENKDLNIYVRKTYYGTDVKAWTVGYGYRGGWVPLVFLTKSEFHIIKELGPETLGLKIENQDDWNKGWE